MNIAMVGDVMLGRLVNEVLKERGPDYPWGNTLSILHGADLRVCNLECVISDDGEPWSPSTKAFHFRSDAKNVDALLAARIDAVSLANNHALDYGYDALLDTLEVLDGVGIVHAGAGRTLKEAEEAVTLTVGGTTIGMVAFTDNEPGWEATTSKPGIFYVPVDLSDARAKHLLEVVRENKPRVDLLLVSAHWGSNWGYVPPPDHISFAHALVDAGADVLFGHSAHVFRGLEIYHDRPIIYGAGDFVDDYAVDPIERNDESFIFLLRAEAARVSSLRLFPTSLAWCQTNLATESVGRAIGRKMQQLCARFQTSLRWGEAHAHLEAGIPQV